MRISEVMTKDVIVLKRSDSIKTAAGVFSKNDIHSAPVVENGKIIGMVTESDILRHIRVNYTSVSETILPSPFDLIEIPIRQVMGHGEMAMLFDETASVPVSDIMTSKVHFINSEASTEDAAIIMTKKKVNQLPVIDESGKLVGIIDKHDIVRALAGNIG